MLGLRKNLIKNNIVSFKNNFLFASYIDRKYETNATLDFKFGF